MISLLNLESKRETPNSNFMKTKIILLIGSVALITLSFTFVSVNEPLANDTPNTASTASAPVGGLYADEVTE